MTASEYLAQFDFTVEQAQDFIIANLDTPEVIYSTARQAGVTNAMLAEIYGSGITAGQVEAFFNSIGLDGTQLNESEMDFGIISTHVQELSEVIGLNDYDQLSPSELSEQVIEFINSIDLSEIEQAQNFVMEHEAALLNGDEQAYDEYAALLLDMIQDPATASLFDFATVEDLATTVEESYVELLGTVDTSALIDDAILGW